MQQQSPSVSQRELLMQRGTNTTYSLRAALLGNAVFSAVCALLMLIWPSTIEAQLGIQAPLFLRLVGFGLLLFAVD